MAALLNRLVMSATGLSGKRRYAQTSGAIVLVLAVVATSTATAQRFQSITPKITVKEANALRGSVAKALRDPTAFQANKKAFEDYFNKFYFPSMTLPSQLGELGKRRENLFKQFIRPAKSQEARKRLTELTLKAMRAISRGNFHPAVRYNAVLILGMLDEKVAGGGGVKPVPLPAGANSLLELLENEEFKKVKVPASLKLGSLIGLERHAKFGIDPRYAKRLTKASLAMIAREESPADLDADVFHWMKCQAARVLSRQFAEGPNAQVQAALTGLIADPHMNLEDRCCVAELMKQIKYDSSAGVDVTATVGALGDLTKTVVSDEAEKANRYQQEILRGDDTNQQSRFEEEELTYQRRRLLARLHSISEGGRSLSKGLPEAERQQLQSLLSTFDAVMEAAEDKDSSDLEITPKVLELKSQVRSVVESWKPTEAAPAEEAKAQS